MRIWAHSQETEAEDADETHLLGEGQPQSVEHRQRQDEDGNIGCDVPRGKGIPLEAVGDARGFDTHVPEARYGPALEDDEAELQCAPHPDDCKQDAARCSHLWQREYPQVMQEEADFDCYQGQAIKNDGDEEGLFFFFCGNSISEAGARNFALIEVERTLKKGLRSSGCNVQICRPRPFVVS